MYTHARTVSHIPHIHTNHSCDCKRDGNHNTKLAKAQNQAKVQCELDQSKEDLLEEVLTLTITPTLALTQTQPDHLHGTAMCECGPDCSHSEGCMLACRWSQKPQPYRAMP